MITHVNPLLIVLERLGCADPAKGAFFFWDEVEGWPAGSLDMLVTGGLLQQAQPMAAIECNGCEENCMMPVTVYPTQEDKTGRAFITCAEHGRIKVSFDRMRQWQATGELIASAVAKLLGLSQPSKQAVDGWQWRIGTLKGKKHNSPVMLLAGNGLAITLAGHAVPLADVLTIEKNTLALDKAALIRMVDNPTDNSKDFCAIGIKNTASDPDQDSPTIPCEVFLAMKNLTDDEVSIAFVGDRTESGLGANNMLEISARGVTKRVALAALDLVDRRKGTLNSQGIILLGMAQKRKLARTEPNAAKVTRLRKVINKHIGIKADPFEPYRQGAGWVPRFKIADKRGAADERAKREAERRTESYEQMNESGEKWDDTSQMRPSFGSENDAADDWLKDNDPSAST